MAISLLTLPRRIGGLAGPAGGEEAKLSARFPTTRRRFLEGSGVRQGQPLEGGNLDGSNFIYGR